MKINLNNPYGYKVCYSTPKRKRKLIDKVHTNTYGLAQFEKRRYESSQERYPDGISGSVFFAGPENDCGKTGGGTADRAQDHHR